ncbi:MAG: helix-turn-helix transcriptional regulator [Polaromonas sp.]|jgi:transcriptional regulator with XRE-family HTH domain|nr:helix-turn-helix transcriptional regulator [Polaromonas sp.]
MSFRYDEIGLRLKAFRLGSGLSAEEIGQRIGISRTALYRFEKGELAKIETLEKLSDLLDVSLPTLLGVGIEYIPSAPTYFERVRQLEEKAEHIVILAGPLSFLLATAKFETALNQVLKESIPDDLPNRDRVLSDVDKVIEILHVRMENYQRRRPSVVNLISAIQIENFLTHGLVGRVGLSNVTLAERRELARLEVKHLVSLIKEESMGTQIGLVTDNLPGTGFMLFRQGDRSTLAITPFRLGENPNIRVGVAMVTSAPEAVKLHEKVVQEAWRTAIKGTAAAAYLTNLLDKCHA